MLHGPPFCCFKQAFQANLGGTLHLSRRTLLCGENCGYTTKLFLWAQTSTGCWEIYQILHCMRHRQANHQEARQVHFSTYSQSAVEIHLHGLYVWPTFYQAW